MLAALCTLFLFVACDNGSDAPDEVVIMRDVMVEIPSGTFMMGSPTSESQRHRIREGRQQREVTLTGFCIGKYPVTQGQYYSVTGDRPSWFQGARILDTVNRVILANWEKLPVEQVSWYDAVVFCNRLSVMEGRAPAYFIDRYAKDPNYKTLLSDDKRWLITPLPETNGYRLPTEAQWEYACRAGTATAFNTGGTINTDEANFNGTPYISGEPRGRNLARTTEVGSYPPNGWGLYDMHGNVYEWVWDFIWEDAEDNEIHPYINYYVTHPGPIADPQGGESGDRRVSRGGSWFVWAARLRSAWRERNNPSKSSRETGFRVVCPLPGEVWKENAK